MLPYISSPKPNATGSRNFPADQKEAFAAVLRHQIAAALCKKGARSNPPRKQQRGAAQIGAQHPAEEQQLRGCAPRKGPPQTKRKKKLVAPALVLAGPCAA